MPAAEQCRCYTLRCELERRRCKRECTLTNLPAANTSPAFHTPYAPLYSISSRENSPSVAISLADTAVDFQGVAADR